MTDAATILALWEAGQGPARGLAVRLLAAAGEADPARLTLGEAARQLLALRARLVGDTLACVAACPSCEEVNEAAIAARALATVPGDATPVRVAAEGWRATARQLTLADFDEAAGCTDVEATAALLCERAVVSVERPEGTAAEEPMPAALLEAVEAALDAADGLADARIGFTCASCGAAWDTAFEPAAFLAEELGAKAQRSLAEIAALARAYGWSEADILAMSPERRRAYLELAA